MKKLLARFLVLTLLVTFSGVGLVAPAGATVISTHTFYWGPAHDPWVKIVERVYDEQQTQARTFPAGQKLFEYEVTNIKYNPPGGNGLSGFNIRLRNGVTNADVLSMIGPPGWSCYNGTGPAGSGNVEWDIRASVGTGLMPGQTGIFGFTVPATPQFRPTLYPDDFGNWMHSWNVNDVQFALFFGPISGPKKVKVIGPSDVISPPEDPLHPQDMTRENDEQTLSRTLPINVDVVHTLFINTYRKPWWPWPETPEVLEALAAEGITPEVVGLARALESEGIAAGLGRAKYQEAGNYTLPETEEEALKFKIPPEMDDIGIPAWNATGLAFDTLSAADLWEEVLAPEVEIVPPTQGEMAAAVDELRAAIEPHVDQINEAIAKGEPSNLPQLLEGKGVETAQGITTDVIDRLSPTARAILFLLNHKNPCRQKDKLELGDVSPSLRPGRDGFDLAVKSNDEWIETISWTNLRGVVGDDAEGWTIPANQMLVFKNGHPIPNGWVSPKYHIHYAQENIWVILKPHWSIHAGKYVGSITITATQV
ncbi:MAG: hypothetical protein AB1466_04450 [Actinomycetota bacterium]